MKALPDEKPLVSIVVITYNSSRFVLETLESCKAQTYDKIELIISDDASSDSTVDLCQLWLNKNIKRFVSAQIITVEKNTGVSANCNRGIFAAKGEWIKLIAGDDLLIIDCIKDNIEFFNQHPEKKNINVISSRILYFKENINRIIDRTKASILDHPEIKASDQYLLFCYGVGKRINSLLIRKSSIDNIGGADEIFTLQEDTSLIGRLLIAGNKFFFLDRDTFFYRLHSSSITGSKNNFLIRDFDMQNAKSSTKYRSIKAGFLPSCLYHLIYFNSFFLYQLERSKLSFFANRFSYYLLIGSFKKTLTILKNYKTKLIERKYNKIHNQLNRESQ